MAVPPRSLSSWLFAAVLLKGLILAAFATNHDIELSYILECQAQNALEPHVGAINNVYPDNGFSWIVPSEVAVAAWTLLELGKVDEALAAGAFLARVQTADGSWANRYDGIQPVGQGRQTRQTVQPVMLLAALHNRGLSNHSRELDKATWWLRARLTPSGLLDGGLWGNGVKMNNLWLSDNAYAVVAWHRLGAAALRQQVVDAINAHFFYPERSSWHQRLGPDLKPIKAPFGWIHFAPAQLDLQAFGVFYPGKLARRMKDSLQVTSGRDSGAVIEREGAKKHMPGIGFQASLAWRDLGEDGAVAAHTKWSESVSGLWQESFDAKGVRGGWIDWRDFSGKPAPSWERFIDTSAYHLMVVRGLRFHHGCSEPTPCKNDGFCNVRSPAANHVTDSSYQWSRLGGKTASTTEAFPVTTRQITTTAALPESPAEAPRPSGCFLPIWWCRDQGAVAPAPSTTTTVENLDCHSMLYNWASWKIAWCCHHKGKGCSMINAAQTFHEEVAGTTALPTTVSILTTTEALDCGSEYYNWASWKKVWCCEHKQIGCEITSPAPSEKETHDCEVGFLDRRASGWSEEKWNWCCRNHDDVFRHGRGCKTVASYLFKKFDAKPMGRLNGVLAQVKIPVVTSVVVGLGLLCVVAAAAAAVLRRGRAFRSGYATPGTALMEGLSFDGANERQRINAVSAVAPCPPPTAFRSTVSCATPLCDRS